MPERMNCRWSGVDLFLIARRREVVFSLLLIFCLLAASAVFCQSATWDEVSSFGIGKYLLQNFKWDVPGSILHPPLSYYISSFPLLFFNTEEKVWKYEHAERNLDFLKLVDIGRGQALLSSASNSHDRLLIQSRLMIVLIGALLGYFIYCFSRALYGEIGGLFSLFFYVLCPNMLAFAGLIVPDMALTAFSFIAVYFLWMSFTGNKMSFAALAGICLGLALLSKFTALLLIPVFTILFGVRALKEKGDVLKNIVIISFCAVLVLFLGYAFDISPYLKGLGYQWSHAATGHSSFLWGYYSETGWWHYHIFAFLIKTPIPALIMFALASFLYFKHFKSEWLKGLFLLIPAISILALFTIKHQSIGLRYVLPMYPFLYVFVGSVPKYMDKKYILYPLACWSLLSCLYVAPHFLSYFNESVGGPGNGYKYLVDSNLDWGQDLKGLKKFMEKNHIERVSLSYFGSDSPQRYGIAYDWMPSYYLARSEDSVISVPRGWLAISATNLQGVYFSDKGLFKWLERYQPTAKIGYSIFVYDFRSPGSLNFSSGKAMN